MGMLFIAVIGGTIWTYAYDDDSALIYRLCEGACTGIGTLSMVGFLLALCLRSLDATGIIVTAALGTLSFLLLLRPAYRARVKADIRAIVSDARYALTGHERAVVGTAILFAFLIVMLWLVFQRAMYERAGAIYTGIVHNVGDLPFHLQVIASFAYGQNFPPEHPAYADSPFVYPFLADFGTAMWVRAGTSVSKALFAQGVVLAISLIVLMHRFTWVVTRNRAAAALAPVLVLFSGGLGWWLAVHDIAGSRQGIAAALMHLPRNYTITTGTSWRWPNALTALLVTQRSLLLGLPTALCILVQWWLSGADQSGREGNGGSRPDVRRRMFAAGLLTGLLPLVHGHTFLVVMALGASFAMVSRKWQIWSVFFCIALGLALPQIWWSTRGSTVHLMSFLGWGVGWDRAGQNVLWFWLKNTGLFIPLLIAALFWRERGGGHVIPERAWLFYLPFVGCFVVPNLVRLAPWLWDNIKVLFYWYVASVPVVALFLVWLWGKGGLPRLIAAGSAAALILAGVLDVWRVISGATEYREFDRDGIAMAEQIRDRVEPNARILHAPVYNSAVFLTGRRSLMGYAGTMWTHGLSYAQREADIQFIYSGAPNAPALLERYRIEYVMLSPLERAYTRVNRGFFERYHKVIEAGGYRLYAINSTR